MTTLHNALIRTFCGLPALAAIVTTANAFAAAPAVVADAQQTIGSNFYNPRGIATAPNGTMYVADSDNNQIVAVVSNLPGSSTQTKVATPGYFLTTPQGLAVDAAGDLYIADTPVLGVTSRIIEVLASNGVLTSNIRQIYLGGLLKDPVALTVAGNNVLYVGDEQHLGTGALYTIAPGGSPKKINITGLPIGFAPGAVSLDGKGELYFTNSAAANGGLYVAPSAGGAAQPITAGSFAFGQPTGLGLDSTGDLFVLAQLQNGPGGEQVIEFPAATRNTPYLLPSKSLGNSSALEVDSAGNVNVVEANNGQRGKGVVLQFNYLNPVFLGDANVYKSGPAVQFNFEWNAPATITGFHTVTVGDAGAAADVVKGSGNCAAKTLTSSTTAYQPFICNETFEATPQYVGTRVSAIQVAGSGNNILESVPVYEMGDAAAQISYPLDVTATQLGFIQPQGIVISGFDQKIYVADFSGDAVYSIGGLNGSAAQPVSTGSIHLQAPSAVAMNGEGDLFIADFLLGKVVVVPTTTGKSPFYLNTGTLLQHPISLAVDALGDVYIGDAGAEGTAAVSAAPGFVVEVPYRGSAFLLPMPGASIVFPQALAVDNVNGNLFIGDGGSESSGTGQVVKVPVDGSKASTVAITGVPLPASPSGLVLDAAQNLYVLDGVAGTITVVPPAGASHLLDFNNSTLSAPSALAISAGAQSFVIANLGGGSSNALVYLNGNSATLAFGNHGLNTTSAPQTATVANIGNQTLILNSSYYSPKTMPGFYLTGSNGCAGNDSLPVASAGCTFSIEFAPETPGLASQAVKINSNAYNSGTPLIHLSGDGLRTTKLR
jgi:sugar lactone lactonase YvrE